LLVQERVWKTPSVKHRKAERKKGEGKRSKGKAKDQGNEPERANRKFQKGTQEKRAAALTNRGEWRGNATKAPKRH